MTWPWRQWKFIIVRNSWMCHLIQNIQSKVFDHIPFQFHIFNRFLLSNNWDSPATHPSWHAVFIDSENGFYWDLKHDLELILCWGSYSKYSAEPNNNSSEPKLKFRNKIVKSCGPWIIPGVSPHLLHSIDPNIANKILSDCKHWRLSSPSEYTTMHTYSCCSQELCVPSFTCNQCFKPGSTTGPRQTAISMHLKFLNKSSRCLDSQHILPDHPFAMMLSKLVQQQCATKPPQSTLEKDCDLTHTYSSNFKWSRSYSVITETAACTARVAWLPRASAELDEHVRR